MTNARRWLGALLVLQLALALGLAFGRQQADAGATAKPLLPATTSAVDRLVISDGESTATLARRDGNWVLPELQQLPASNSQITDILQRLDGTVTEWPVATTRGSHERFEVSPQKFQRRVQLFVGEEQVAEFYLGTSPGFRKVHLRRDGEDPVYAVSLNTFDLPATDDAWLDKSLLAVAEPTRITGGDYALSESDDGVWSLAGGDTGADDAAAPLDDERARQLVSAFANLRVQSVATSPPTTEDPGVTIEVGTAEGSYRYHFYRTDDTYFVHRDDRDPVFSLSQYDYDRITGVGLAELAHKAEDAAAEDTGTQERETQSGS